MSSPFPGMDPYLEQPDAWHDFHEAFCLAIREALVPQIRPTYFAKVDEHIFLHELSAEERQFLGRSDVAVTRGPDSSESSSGGTFVAPTKGTVPLAVDEERLGFVQVLDRKTREVVTVIELLSPSNKDSGQNRGQYIEKRARLLNSPVHLVEIDLLRGGQRPTIDDRPECDYCVMVSRAEMRPSVDLWSFFLRDPLPKIPIPLRVPDPDAVLDLNAILDRVYDAAGYEDYIYSGSPVPPLSPVDAQWSAERLAGTARFNVDTPEP